MWDLIKGVNIGVEGNWGWKKKKFKKIWKKDLLKNAAVYKTPENHESPYGYYVCNSCNAAEWNWEKLQRF